MAAVNSLWKCPVCLSPAPWDDENYERHEGAQPTYFDQFENFDPHKFVEELRKVDLHVIDLTGPEPKAYVIPADEPKRVRGLTYEEWLKEVNRHVEALSGQGLDDIGDWESNAAWRDGTSPSRAAHEALAESDFPFEED